MFISYHIAHQTQINSKAAVVVWSKDIQLIQKSHWRSHLKTLWLIKRVKHMGQPSLLFKHVLSHPESDNRSTCLIPKVCEGLTITHTFFVFAPGGKLTLTTPPLVCREIKEVIISDRLRLIFVDKTELKVAGMITEGFLFNLSSNEHAFHGNTLGPGLPLLLMLENWNSL